MISRFAKSLFIILFALVGLTMLAMLHPPSRAYLNPLTGQLFGEGGVEQTLNRLPQEGVVHGGVIMAKLGNETAKAALGRATWKLLHTVTLRFPENPTPDEREALDSYIRLTSRVYPCGECAAELQELLKVYPPQTSSRRAASLWLCSLHNQVNERLNKPEYDCSQLSTEYDCGCGDDPLDSTSTKTTANPSKFDPMDLEIDTTKDEITGAGLIKGGR
ncbi:hypothetical protein AGABI1DRAFT_112947 [Agaricus bisporus var. burnettii JB137-S8]|uniref:Sulfhydryl oxidase n=1 Tax=Agaricus bisporus var. burnettii (strain JB137-S8 / ATCC MYA-4627 / FGSC 10392) TaxID=597362 RepID=K5W3A6_AGABU|nr:uncharacterized protein AGABI1DRAFT_112947 [Agaricus bisporus var. burnettii JB137-S8]EKM81279.1 hypothetical protein AGABI1DRAFT_112947 [Agaricus bisporus var. burnettii JB137-S8]